MKCDEKDICKPSSLLRKDITTDKENVDKPNVPKLSLELKQMKRKKCNLRKSLAWDKAFFTEEGVLDSLELSVLSGNVDKQMLSVISEGGESVSGSLECSNDLPDSKLLLFKELPANTEGGTPADSFSSNPASLIRDKGAPASVAKRKVPSAYNISQSAAKRSGFLHPVTPSSLKRPSDTKKSQVSKKGSKVSELLVPKPDPPEVSAAPRSSHLKHNQIPHSAACDGQKNIKPKETSTISISARQDMKLGPDKLFAKSTAHNARSKVSPVRKISPPTNVLHPKVTRANNCPVTILDPVSAADARSLNSFNTDTSKLAVSFSQNTSYNGGNIQYTESQTAKPSELRMPSPSLGFFSQSKLSSSLSLLERIQTGKHCPSNIPSLNKASMLNPIHQQPPQPSKKIPAYSRVGPSAASAGNHTSHGKIEFNLELNKEVVCSSHRTKTYDGLNNQQQLQSIVSDNQLLICDGPCGQLKKGDHGERITEVCLKGIDMTSALLDFPQCISTVSLAADDDGFSEKNVMTAHHRIEDRQHIATINGSSDYSDFLSSGISDKSEQETKKAHDQLSRMQEVNNQTAKQADLVKLDACQTNPVSNADGLSPWISSSASNEGRSAEGLNNCIGSNIAAASLDSQDHTASKHEIPYSRSCCSDIWYSDNESTRIGNLYGELHVGDAQLQSVDGDLSLETGEKSILNDSAVDDLSLMIIGDSSKTAELSEVLFPCTVKEQAVNNDCGAHYDGYLFPGNNFSSEDSKEKNLSQNYKFMTSNADACGGDLESVGSKSPVNQDSSFTAAGKAECLHVENALVACVDRELSKVASGVHCMSGDQDAVDNCSSCVKIFIIPQPENDSDVRVTSILENNSSISMQDWKEDMERSKVITSCCESDHCNQNKRESNDVLLSKNRSFEDPSKLSNSSIACVRETNASEVGSLHEIHQCEIVEQTNEIAGVNIKTNKTVMPSAEPQSLEYNPLSDSYNNNSSPLIDNSISKILVDDNREQPEECSAVQNPYLMIRQAAQENREFFSDDNVSHKDISSVELQKRDDLCNGLVFDDDMQEPTLIKNSTCLDEDGKAEHVFMNDTEPGFIDILPSVESSKHNVDDQNKRDNELIDLAASSEFNSSSINSEHQISSPANDCDLRSFCSPNESSKLTVKTKGKSSQRTTQGVEVDLADRYFLPEEAETEVPQTSSSFGIELQHELDMVHPVEDKGATLSPQKPVNNKKQDVCVKPPPNVVPFSDEWLAAFEAAGEEILTMKGGAVQNSPPDKLPHEPSPWSPVRRNGQGIGPFDCTKFTNFPPSTLN